MNKNEDYMEIDLVRLFGALWRKAWAIILAGLLFGAIAFGYTKFMVTPLYKARTLMYVNNNSISVGETKVNISSGDLSAAKSLVNTYMVILNTRTTLEDVIERAGLGYSYEQLKGMIGCSSVNSTEIFYVEVTNPNPKEAEIIANTIGQVLPEKIAAVVEGSSVRIVDYAVEPSHKASPNLTKNIAMGILLGMVLACGVIVLLEIRDDKIHNSDYLIQRYDIPVLAVIPDLTSRKQNYGGYYSGDYHMSTGNQGGMKRG